MLKVGQFCLWAGLIWFITLCCGLGLVCFGCGPAMPKCDTLGEWRCDGSEVHMCESEQWSFRFDCSKIGTEDGGIIEKECEENDGLAECV